jgi:hypothetical protein
MITLFAFLQLKDGKKTRKSCGKIVEVKEKRRK